MAFRPSRRQLLSSLFFSAASGLGVSFIATKSAYAHPYTQTTLETARTPAFNPATDLQPLSSTRQNTYPIILVHGLAGFVTLGSFNYWGGIGNVAQDLDNNGYTAYPVSMGPFSSNWDRACELYAQIKGGTVDYGQAHASKYGHARYGRTFSGVSPQWGEINPQTGKVNKVHLLTHSMGGQTARMLAQLLATGSADERAATPPDQLSPLFAGNKASWLDGLLAISAPHDGSSAIYLVKTALPFLKQFIIFLAAAQADHNLVGYDFMLDQWGLARKAGESLSTYTKRIENSQFATTKDGAAWELNPAGASELNGLARAQTETYYFSLGTLQTYTELLTRHQLPDITMNPLFVDFSIFMGQYTQNSPIPIDRSWWPDDGLVNTNSMDGPTLNSTDVIVPYSGATTPGKWNYFGTMNGYGHIDIIGWGIWDVRPVYRSLAAFLGALPL